MPEDEGGGAEAKASGEGKGKPAGRLDLLKAVAMPMVTLVVGYLFNESLNSRQIRENNVRLYTEMMGRREQADSDLRKDMFKSILDTFMKKDPKLSPEENLNLEVLNLELLAYNFHESLDIGPLFKHVRRRIPEAKEGHYADMLSRLESVAVEVNERQLTVLSDAGSVERGGAPLQEGSDDQTFLRFGPHTVSDPNTKPGEGVSRLCLSMDSADGVRHYRQFKLEVFEYDLQSREAHMRLYASKVLSRPDCERADLDQVANREIDTNFWVGLFDFPMIDNTRLSHGERCAVALTVLTPHAVQMAVAYFPSSRASMKDKPYYDELMHDLVQGKQVEQRGGP
jgi:hypothetical protein